MYIYSSTVPRVVGRGRSAGYVLLYVTSDLSYEGRELLLIVYLEKQCFFWPSALVRKVLRTAVVLVLICTRRWQFDPLADGPLHRNYS